MTSESVEESVTLSVNQARRAVVVAMMADKPVALWGESGLGKSTVIREICDKLGYEFFDFRMSDKEPTDGSGIPVPDLKEWKLKFLTTDLIPWDRVVGKRKAALVLDEFDRSEPQMQNVALQLVHDREVNGNKLGENVVVILAGNGTSDVYTTPLAKAAARRMVHLYVSRRGPAGLRSYENWAESNGIEKAHFGFARFCNETWSAGVEEEEDAMEHLGQPCPRTFDMARDIYNELTDIDECGQFADSGGTKDIKLALIAGCCGQAGAHAYIAWRDMCAEAPDPTEVLAHPDTAGIPDGRTETGKLYMLVSSIADTIDNYEDAEKATTYFLRVSEAGSQEIAAMGFRRMIATFENAATVAAYIAWEEAHKELLR